MLDPTAKRANFVFSMKKFLIENLYDVKHIQLVFDSFLTPDDTITRWLFIMFNPIDRDTVSNFSMDVFCVSREDFESDDLNDLTDTVIGSFVDSTQLDGRKRIPVYDKPNQTVPIGYLLTNDCLEGPVMLADQDKSKYMRITISFKMVTN